MFILFLSFTKLLADANVSVCVLYDVADTKSKRMHSEASTGWFQLMIVNDVYQGLREEIKKKSNVRGTTKLAHLII